MGLVRHGNEQADTVAKEAVQLEITECNNPVSDVKHILNLYINNKWRMEWMHKQQTVKGESSSKWKVIAVLKIDMSRL